MSTHSFINELSKYQGDGVFNPYRDQCADWDRADAPQRRRANLKHLLDATLDAQVDTIWVARDLGYRGGRRTGIPLTDEVHLTNMEQLYSSSGLSKATKGDVMAERTAAIVWQALMTIDRPVMLWNVFPFHPHQKGNHMSNRCHTRKERRETLPLLWDLINLLNPVRLVAIGRDAQEALVDAPVPVLPVRHPSYGGQREFLETLFAIYGVEQT